MNIEPEILEALGISPADFAARTRECGSFHAFPSVALGQPDNVVHCQMRGNHKKHKAIFYGIPYEWEAQP